MARGRNRNRDVASAQRQQTTPEWRGSANIPFSGDAHEIFNENTMPSDVIHAVENIINHGYQVSFRWVSVGDDPLEADCKATAFGVATDEGKSDGYTLTAYADNYLAAALLLDWKMKVCDYDISVHANRSGARGYR